MNKSLKLFHWAPGILCTLVMLFADGFALSAQDTLSNGKALNFPAKRFGISIGNSYKFTGIRINLADKNVKRINGLNVTFWSDNALRFEKWMSEASYNSVINGISIGIIPTAGSMQPINIGLLEVRTSPNNLNGFSVGGLAVFAGKINGLAVSGLLTQTAVINGIVVSGLLVGGVRGINGLAIGGLVVSSDTRDIKGVAFSPGVLFCGKNFKGVGISGLFLRSELFKGIAIAGFARTNQMYGLSIALYNRTNELRGLQLGLLNFAGNNPKGSRLLPLINMHFRKNK